MPEKKIVDLATYRQKIAKTGNDPDPSNIDDLSFEEKLQNLIHRPVGETGSKKELIAIFEEEQLKKDMEDQDK